jgi:hypothetical protein
MTDHDDTLPTGVETPQQQPVPETEAAVPVAEVAPPVLANGIAAPEESAGWRTEAGRKGARRIHELINHGKLYEQEHGLKSGRQRLRQLIEEGKLYEQEHGLNGGRRRRARPPRASGEQLLTSLLQTLLRLTKPRFRKDVTRLLEALQNERQ